MSVTTKLIELYIEMSEFFGMWIIPPEGKFGGGRSVLGGSVWGMLSLRDLRQRCMSVLRALRNGGCI